MFDGPTSGSADAAVGAHGTGQLSEGQTKIEPWRTLIHKGLLKCVLSLCFVSSANGFLESLLLHGMSKEGPGSRTLHFCHLSVSQVGNV